MTYSSRVQFSTENLAVTIKKKLPRFNLFKNLFYTF